ncbi:MAG: hypothetical protein CMJ46_11845 [Planctomyces sp.]|nr:hypothetical protein [Planctomyces sp.]
MTVTLFLQLMLSLIAGLLLGAVFFGGLWLTVKHLPTARHPALLFLASALGRTGLTLAGFWLVGVWLSSDYQWQRLVAALLGFVITRYLCTRYIESRPGSVSQDSNP